MKKKIFQQVFVTEFAFDPSIEKTVLLIKSLNGNIIKVFTSVTDYTLWCENNLFTQEMYDELMKDSDGQENN